MSFDALLGNERLKENISRSIARGRPSHFYLISGPKGSGKHTLATLLAAALNCTGADKPCLSCAHCRKTLGGNHPDYITVFDPDHKNLPVKIVRQVRDEMFVRPNEGTKKIYMIPQEMGTEGQNALLKVLEEPPSYGVFILLTENPNSILPTIRSRCTHLAMSGLSEEILQKELSARFPQAGSDDISAAISRSGGYLGQAIALLEQDSVFAPQALRFADAFRDRNKLEIALLFASMEKWKRDQILPVLEQCFALLEEALVCRSGMSATSPQARGISAAYSGQDLLGCIEALKKAILYTKSNVSVAAVCGYLTHALL